MALGDPIDIEVTVSGESNVISSFQGGTTNVTQYSGGNSIISTLAGDTSTTASITGYNVGVTMEGELSTSVGDSSFTPFNCDDLVDCTGSLLGKGETGIFITSASNIGIGSGIYSGTIENDLKLKSISGLGNITISGDDQHVIISGASGITETGHLVGKGESGNFVDKRETGIFITGASNIGIGSGI